MPICVYLCKESRRDDASIAWMTSLRRRASPGQFSKYKMFILCGNYYILACLCKISLLKACTHIKQLEEYCLLRCGSNEWLSFYCSFSFFFVAQNQYFFQFLFKFDVKYWYIDGSNSLYLFVYKNKIYLCEDQFIS